jgi:hypothetical protein
MTHPSAAGHDFDDDGGMALFDSEASSDAPAPDVEPRTQRLRAWSLLYSAVLAIGLGVFIQVRYATVAIACRREGTAYSCSIERRVLLNTVSIGTEGVTGVRRALAVGRAGYRNRPEEATFAVVLYAAEGERDIGRSTMGEPAYALSNAVNHWIGAGAASFEETMPLDLFNGLTRLFGLFLIVLGASLAMFAVVRSRQPADTPAE